MNASSSFAPLARALARVAFAAVALTALFAVRPGVALAEDAPAPSIVLYTVAPGGDLFSLYGHTLVCVEPEGAADPTCYDYGVARASSASDLIWGSIRGRDLFVPTAVPRSVMLKSFEDEERAIWKQPLPFDPAQERAVAASLAYVTKGAHGYVYDPRFANCTTKLRDLVDATTQGKLHEGMDATHPGPTFRAMWEEGLSGQVVPLLATELLLGRGVDRTPTDWEKLLLPSELREAVRVKLGVQPIEVYAGHAGAHVKTSPAAGRVVLVLLGAALALALYLARRKDGAATGPRARLARRVVGVVLGTFGLVVWAVAAASAYPELRWNAALLVLVPTDLALGWLTEDKLRRYLDARLGVVGLVAVASLLGAVRPLLALAFLAAIPLWVVRGVRRRAVRASAPAATPAAP